MTKPGPSVTSGADTQPGSDSLFPSGFGGGAAIRTGGVGTGEIADASVAAADLNLPSVAAALAARAEFTAAYVPLSLSRNVWSIGDSLTAGNHVVAGVMSGTGQGGIQYGGSSWQTHAVLASDARWTHAGLFATAGYTGAQILATHVPSVLAASAKGDTVVVLAGTNGNVLADVISIHNTLRAAGRRTVACTIPPSTASTLSSVAAFNAGLVQFAAANSIPLADIHTAVVDTTTGAYQGGYNNDGVHPNQAGYQVFGQVIAAALTQLYPKQQSVLVPHNAAFTGQLQTKPLALGTPALNTDYATLASLGTSTVAASANASFLGGQGYLFTLGDSGIDVRFNNYTFVAGHRMRIGMAWQDTVSGSALVSIRLENGSGGNILWGMGYSNAVTVTTTASRFYSEFVVPTGMASYSYRLHVGVYNGTGTTLHLGELTVMDLTAMGL